jgi:hypothetical protein
VKKPKPRLAEPINSIVRFVVPASFNPNPASITVKYWWNIFQRNTGNFLRGKKGRIAVVNEFVNEKRQLAQIKEWNEYMNNQLTATERKHLAAVKALPCGVCGSQEGSEAHHIEQHLQYTCIPLCADCHRGSHNGLHGQKRIWKVTKKTELTVLNDTIKKLMNR